MNFPTDYQSIIERIEQIDPVRYAKTRNFLNGNLTYLSPYISRGVISVKLIKDIVLHKGYKPYQVEKFLQELAWREYFQRVWQNKGTAIQKDLKQLQPDTQHQQMISSIEKAETGIEAIDEQINQLYSNGYLHNHVRMYIASIVCNIGKAYWVQPANWMYYHLLDGDIASNNCSWQWVAGAFSSKKYYCNQENINKYTFSKQQHTFIDKNYEEISIMNIPDKLIETSVLKLETKLPLTPLPTIDTAKPTLLYNSYNLDSNWRKEENVNRVLLLEPSYFQQFPVSEKVIQFVIDLSGNINNLQIFVGEIDELIHLYHKSSAAVNNRFISKEHPAFIHYPGIKDKRDWMFPEVTGYYNSFFSYWKACEKYLK